MTGESQYLTERKREREQGEYYARAIEVCEGGDCVG